MATVTDVTTALLSGLNHIDALLDDGPAWNFLAPSSSNTITYTFSTASGLQTNNTSIQGGVQTFTAAQQAATREAMAYLGSITGIAFVETTSGTAAKVHFANADIIGASTSGLCSSSYNYSYNGANVVTAFNASAYIYLDSVQWGGQNAVLSGGQGLETLLHEMGHMMGLKHPFDDSIQLPSATDNTAYTLMSYTDSGGPYAAYSEYDLAALKWLYGGDGLGGALGVGSTGGGRYVTGTSVADMLTGGVADDALEGGGGNDILQGGAGTDTAIYGGTRSTYSVVQLDALRWTVSGAEGVDTLSGIESLRFSDTTFALNSVDLTAPQAPALAFTKDGTAAASGNRPLFSGSAEAGATVELFNGSTSLGVTTAVNGSWIILPVALANGSYSVTARATDAAGNVSVASAAQAFTVASSLNLTGGTGKDTLAATAGANNLNGGAGTDTVLYSGASGTYTVSHTAYGYTVTDTQGNGGTDLLVGTERIRFADKSLAIDIDGVGGQVYRLYQAAFDRAPDLAGLSYWIAMMDGGLSLQHTAASFVGSAEFANLLGTSTPSNSLLVSKLYANVLHRAPDAAGQAYWLGVLDTGLVNQAGVLASFSDSPENQAQLVGTIQNGFEYTPVG